MLCKRCRSNRVVTGRLFCTGCYKVCDATPQGSLKRCEKHHKEHKLLYAKMYAEKRSKVRCCLICSQPSDGPKSQLCSLHREASRYPKQEEVVAPSPELQRHEKWVEVVYASMHCL